MVRLSIAIALIAGGVAAPASAQQFGGPRRVEAPLSYPYTAVGKWSYSGGGARAACTAFFVNNCTIVTAGRCTFGRPAGKFQFEAADGEKYGVVNIRILPGDAEKPDDLSVAIGQLTTRPGQRPLEGTYGRFAFDKADTVAGSAGFTPHCSYGFSNNDEGKAGRGTLDPDVYVWGSVRDLDRNRVRSDEYFLHMTNGAYGASGSPIFRCTPRFDEDGTFRKVEISAPARLIGLYVRVDNEKDGLKYADRLRVAPQNMALGIGSQQFFAPLSDYVKENPCP